MMRTQCNLLFALLALLLSLITASGDPPVGGWKPIKDINDKHVKEIGEWTVSEYNQQSHKKLLFQRVVQGQKQVVAGMNYELVIRVKDGSSTVNYEGLVYEKPWEKSRKLVSFREVRNEYLG